jgi:D-amino peptidase
MRIYVIADMEGVAGVFLPEQLERGTAEYAEARRLLTGEVNAAIAGAFEGGATEVIVKDAHGTGFNLVMEDVDARAEIVAGASVPARFAGLDESFAGVILLGYHAMAGTEAAICDHTMSTATWLRYELCGVEVGEVGLDAAEAGLFDVPVILVTGDDKVCREAVEVLGGAVLVCQVKTGLARHGVRTLAPRAARKLVRAAAREAVATREQPPPYRPEPPYAARVTYVLTSHADARYCDGVTAIREDGRTIRYESDSLADLLRRSLR